MKNYRSTRELADVLKVKPASIRRGFCVNGHYLGIKPIKMPNGRLLWPDVDPVQLAAEKGAA